MRLSAFISIPLLVATAAISVAETAEVEMDHDAHTPGMAHGAAGEMQSPGRPPASILTEPGQGAFAALAEAVRVLEADPSTDWSKVDLSALRDHLRDMDWLVTGARVDTRELTDGLRMSVTADAETIGAVRRMVPAHAAELASDLRWSVEARAGEDGATLIVTSDDAAMVARIKGLGFFGLMASQDHHREHHLMIARGQAAHSHD